MKKKICGALNSSKNIFLKVVKLINKNKKKIVIGLSVFLIVFISVFSFINLRYPTKINAYIAHVINKGEPANSYFDDENFYNAVIDAYNKENKTSLPYTTNLTDEQLGGIRHISHSCLSESDSVKIKNATGVEKLTSLISFGLANSNISNINLSKNTSLMFLDLWANEISGIDLGKNAALKNLNLGYNKISNIDLSQNTSLTSLSLEYNDISNIDLSQNTSLTDLLLDFNKISNIDLSQNTALTRLHLNKNSLSNIDLSQNTALKELTLSNNNISNIDLSQNTALKDLRLGGNKISNIGLSNNTSITHLELNVNNLGNIDLSQNTALTYLSLGGNKISNINLSNNTSLTELGLVNNNFVNELYLRKNGAYKLPIILPEQLKNKYVVNDETIASFNSNVITGINVGTASTTLDSTISKITINVYDMTSSKYKINDDEKYIYTKNDTDSNTILSNINFDNVNGRIDNNKLILYDGNTIVDEYKIINVSSDKYDLTKNYVYNVNNSLDVSDIKCINCKAAYENNKLMIKYNVDIVEEIDVVSINFESSEYDLTKDYIYIGNKELDESKFNLINCTLQVDNDTLNIKYDNDVLKSYKLVKIYSNTYDLNKNYIYVGNGIFDKNLLSVINGTVNVLNDKIEIKYNSDVLKEFKLLKYSSNKYDLTKEYIYLGINNFDKNNISLVNLSLNIDDNYNLNIKYGDDVMKTYKLVSVSSSKYDLSKDNIKVTKSDGLDFKDIKVTNGTKEYLDNKLYIKYNDDILKVYTISTRAKGDITGDDKITIADVSLLYRHVRKTKVIEDSKTLEVSDLTGDDKITIADVAKLYRYVRGKITEL